MRESLLIFEHGSGIHRAALGSLVASAKAMVQRILLAVCLIAPGVATAQSFAPAGWADELKLNEPADRNPDPKIVEIDLTAKLADVVIDGKTVKAWTYDGGIPGPLIKTRVGDRLIVHFRNELDEPTTVHWHGVRVPIEMDGVPEISQPEVKKGESFTYDFTVRDAGLYWYHPHVMSAAQVGFGLYGALLVEDPEDGAGVADQLTLVLSDIGFDARGKLEPADSGGSAGMVFGREGDYVLANGRRRPTLKARSGAPQRWRIVNAAKSRFFYLDIDGQPFTVIGTDGGFQAQPTTTDILLITPGERVDVIGVSKGRGFAGTIKRHNFGRQPKTHGQSDRERAPGSVGATTTPGRTLPGQRMAGRMGNDRVTAQNLEVVVIDPERNLIAVRGSVPGAKGGIVMIKPARVRRG